MQIIIPIFIKLMTKMCKLYYCHQNIRTFAWRLSLSLPHRKEKVRTREMAVDSPTGVIIAAVLLHAATTMVCGSDAVLKLERLIPPNHELGLTQLRAFDSARHGRLLQSPVGGVVNFPVDGVADPFLVGYLLFLPICLFTFRFQFSKFSSFFVFREKFHFLEP